MLPGAPHASHAPCRVRAPAAELLEGRTLLCHVTGVSPGAGHVASASDTFGGILN